MSFEFKGKVYELVPQTFEEHAHDVCTGCAFRGDRLATWTEGCESSPSCVETDEHGKTYVYKEVTEQ